jgi:hypothetical protein
MTQRRGDYDQAVFGLGAAIGTAAGYNHYEATGDWRIAVRKGLGAFVRIVCWLFLAFWWVVCIGLLSGSTDLDAKRAVGLWMVLVLPFFGVLWCRNGDYGLFRHGPVYRLFSPIARLFEWLPTIVIYLIILVPSFAALGV